MATPTFEEPDIPPPSPVKLESGEGHGDELGEGDDCGDSLSGSPKRGKKKRDTSALRKAPQAPKRFKSSYICFFMAKQPEIKEALGDKATVTEISKRSAEMWRNLPADERVHWDEVAAKDKQRYMVEKASYTGPWQVPWKRAKKDPSAPKRPMSAFLYFSQGRRKQIKDENPEMKNTEVSRLLGEMWRNASEDERRPHIEKEKEERGKYKIAIADWRKEYEKKKEEQRKQQAAQAAQQAQWAQQQQQQQYQHQESDPSLSNHMHYAQPPPYGMPPPAPGHYGHYAPPPPQYYASYPPPPGPYQYPTNGKQPVILGPNGMPHFAPPPQAPATNYSPPTYHPPSQVNYDDGHGQVPASPQNYDYVPEQIPEPQTAG